MKKKPRTLRENQIENAYPNVSPPLTPVSNKILVQYRTERTKRGSILLPDAAKEDAWKTQIVKVIAIGPLCFCTRDLNTGQVKPFQEGPWYSVGDYVRVPQYGLDLVYKVPSAEETARIKAISDEAREIGPSAVFVADTGLFDSTKVKFALLDFTDVKAIAADPLDTLNGI